MKSAATEFRIQCGCGLRWVANLLPKEPNIYYSAAIADAERHVVSTGHTLEILGDISPETT